MLEPFFNLFTDDVTDIGRPEDEVSIARRPGRIITRSGTYKAPERIRDYVDPSQCVDRSEGTRETLCVKTMGEMYRSASCVTQEILMPSLGVTRARSTLPRVCGITGLC